MDRATIGQMLEQAAQRLRDSQPNLSGFTDATYQSEWNLTFQFAKELAPLFASHDCDVDPVKVTLGNRRPDIVIHKRGTHHENLLAIEVKRRHADVAGEVTKIRRWWFGAPLSYAFGAVVVITDEGDISVTVLEDQ